MRTIHWVLILTVAAMCCLAAAVWASDSRIESMLPGSGTESYIEDYFLFQRYPTVVARYANLVVASLGTRDTPTSDSPGPGEFGDDRYVGVIGAGDNTNYGVFALFLNQRAVGGSNLDEQVAIDLTWAKQFNKWAFGARLLWETSSADAGATQAKIAPNVGPGTLPPSVPSSDTDIESFNTFGIDVGAKIDLQNNGLLEVALLLAVQSWEQKDAAGAVVTEDDGKLSYAILARIITDVTDKTSLVPVFEYGRLDLSAKGTDIKTRADNLNLGIAIHRELNGKDLLIAGLALQYVKLQFPTAAVQDEESMWSTPTIFFAMEFDIFNWLTGRVGGSKTISSVKEVDTGDATLPKDSMLTSSFDFGLGMGLHFNNFDVDATMNPNALFTGGYFLSGDSTEPIARITGTYYW
jgi:hypothetical protein